MIYKCYSVFDNCSKTYTQPFHLARNEQAVRAFSDAVNSKDHQFAQHPEDYTLFCLGSFDDNTGHYENQTPAPEPLANGLSVKIVKREELIKLPAEA